MKKQRKITAHTVSVYSHGNFLRVVRGEHTAPDVQLRPRVYDTVKEALLKEKKVRILAALRLMPSDKLIDRALKLAAKPIKVTANKHLSEAVKSSRFAFAQLGYDKHHQEIVYIYHRSPTDRGITMVKTGPVLFVRKLLKKYKKPPMRDLNYREKRKNVRMGVAS